MTVDEKERRGGERDSSLQPLFNGDEERERERKRGKRGGDDFSCGDLMVGPQRERATLHQTIHEVYYGYNCHKQQ